MSSHSNPSSGLHKLTIKLIVLGSSNVGKTALITRYCSGNFSGVRRATVGADFMTKKIQIMDYDITLQIWDTAGQERFHQNTLGSSFYRGADGCLLVFDVTNEKSIDQLCQWRDELLHRVGEDYYLPIVVVGNKIDLLPASEISGIYKEDRKTSTSTPPSVEENKDDISENGETWKESPPTATRILSSSSSISDSLKPSARDTVKKWCSENGYGHVETSAKDGDGVTAAVVAISALVVEQLRESGRLDERLAASRRKQVGKAGKGGSKIEVIGEKYKDSSSSCC